MMASQAPNFVVAVTCHRCKGVFYLASNSAWFEAHGETRPCPFCFRVSRVP